MRILIVSRYCAPPSFHGSAQHVQLFALELTRAGHEVLVITGEERAGHEEIEGCHYEKFRLEPAQRGIPRIIDGRCPDLPMAKYAEERLKQYAPEVLHVGVFMRMGEFVFAAKRLGIPVVMMVHDYSVFCLRKFFEHSDGRKCIQAEPHKCEACLSSDLGKKTNFLNRISSFGPFANLLGSKKAKYSLPYAVRESFKYLDELRDAVDYFVTQNRNSAEILVENGISLTRCFTVNQYIGESKLTKYPKDPTAPGNLRPLRFGYVGRWSKEKGIVILRDAIDTLKECDLELWIIAKGMDSDAFQKLFFELAEKRQVKLFNDLSGKALAEKLALLDVAVIPSVCQELGPRTFWECVAQEVPAIVSDSVGHRSYIEPGTNGDIFACGNPEDLAAKMRSLIDSPELVSRWRNNLPSVTDRANWIAQILQIHGIAIHRNS